MPLSLLARTSGLPIARPSTRTFSTTTAPQNWLIPKAGDCGPKTRKGKPRMPTGGSTRGTTVIWGDYGLRMKDHDRRVSAAQLKNGEDTIRKRLRGLKFRLYMRISANIPVYSSGNEVGHATRINDMVVARLFRLEGANIWVCSNRQTRMGKGKGSFDYWASRVAVSKIIFELKGDLHEKVAREAFRLAANKMPGLYEFVKRGDPPVMGITKLDGVTAEELKRPRRKLPPPLGQASTDALPAAIATAS
ncbi:hypothetical protein FGG08_001086 [Glutinoglossum americanum]|uniref:Ribosomal protein L10e/L16 domain-containing protein n=1 Tax=Glutinoglossum americanum TaxID=1670608 RepID=A0A9P8L6H5_9PEZI|nr:hypothetical protein FGG08_001086 [Glutinoglossum americanum]